MRRAARVDANQTQIVSALRAAGATVQSLAAVGKGVPDLLVGIRSDVWLIEVKDPTKPKADQKLKPLQVEWHATWRGKPVVIAYTADDALRAIGAIA